MRVSPKEIIRQVNKGIEPGDVAQSLGIDRSTVYRWMTRAKSIHGGLSSHHLERLSTQPKTIHRFEFTPDQRIAIVNYRKRTGQMAEKIVHKLDLPIHGRTLHRFLAHKHLVREYVPPATKVSKHAPYARQKYSHRRLSSV